jgi:hypothetical protein
VPTGGIDSLLCRNVSVGTLLLCPPGSDIVVRHPTTQKPAAHCCGRVFDRIAIAGPQFADTDLENSESQWVISVSQDRDMQEINNSGVQRRHPSIHDAHLRIEGAHLRIRDAHGASSIAGSASLVSAFFLEMQIGRGDLKH